MSSDTTVPPGEFSTAGTSTGQGMPGRQPAPAVPDAPDTASTPTEAGGSPVLAVLRAPQVGWVLVASLVGRIPLGAAPLALLLFARETMSMSLAGVLVAAYTAGTAAGQPLLARLADRWRQPPVTWLAVALSTIGFGVLTVRPGPFVAVGAAVAAGLGAPPFEACLRVLWKDLVKPRLLHAAYTMDVTVQELIFVVAPLVTVAAVGLGGVVGGLVATAVAQLVGALLFALAPAVRRWRGERASRDWAGSLRSARLRILLAATLLVGSGVGATTVAVTGYAEQAGSRSWTGWLLAAQGTGALIGGVISAGRSTDGGRYGLPGLVTVLAVGYLPLLLTPSLPVMAGLFAVSGMALPAVLTAVFITADRVAPPGTAAETFAWVATAFGVGSALGAAGDGILLDLAGTVAIGFLPAPLAILLAAGLAHAERPRPARG